MNKTRTIYTRNPELWNWAMRESERRNMSLSQYLEWLIQEHKDFQNRLHISNDNYFGA